MYREGFAVVVIELGPSSSLVSVRLSAVRKLNSRTSKRNSERLSVVAQVATQLLVLDMTVRRGQNFS